jgi:hypothetical protein
MITWSQRIFRILTIVVVLALLGNFGVASAENASSTSYKVTDTQFGTGSGNGCSSSYCANDSAGNTATGAASSADVQTQFGANDDPGSDTPLLEVIEDGGSANLGILSTNSTATASTVVKVRAYNISGYTIQISGTPPSQGEHQLDTPSSPIASVPGTEQFGINLKANAAPSVGADPVQVPDSSFSYGSPTTNYNTANEFMYANNDAIAQSSSSTGETDYTISMILNVSNVTPGGQYTGSYNAVVVPVY